MAESSVSNPEPTTTIPYRRYSFDLPLGECVEVAAIAQRFAPIGPSGYVVQAQFRPGGRRWVVHEQNVNAWVDADGTAGPDAGLLDLPMVVLGTICSVFETYSSVAVHVDHDLGTITVRDSDVEFVIDLPAQSNSLWETAIEATSSFVVYSDHLAKLGSVLSTFPVELPEVPEDDSPLPFLQFAFDGGTLKGIRDWGRFGGPKLSMVVPAVGDHTGDFSVFPPVLAREMAECQNVADLLITFSFSESAPNLMVVSGPDLSMRVELGHEQVFCHRHPLVSALQEDGLVVLEDDRIAWDPTVRIIFDEAVVDATITVAPGGLDAHIRLSSLVVKDSPWNLDIAAEINAWNDQWGNVKLIRHDGDVFAVCDIPVGAMAAVPAMARDVIEKSGIVREVIGVFL